MENSPELAALFAAGCQAVEGVLSSQENDCHVIEEELRFEELNDIVNDALLHTKSAAVPLTTKQWAAEARRATNRVSKPVKFAGAACHDAQDSAPTVAAVAVIEEPIFDADSHQLLSVSVLFDGAVEFTCSKQPGVSLSSHGVPTFCHVCNAKNPILMGTSEGEELF
jgi:hypothetical protein